jgi:DNA repair protein RecO (recombination protein O)
MIREEAIVLRLWDFSETSQTAALFTRGQGAIRCLAKGSKRPKAKFSGGLELATRGEGVLIVKPTAELAQLIEWDLRETHFGLRRRVDAHLAGMCALDLVFQAVRDHDPHARLFDALARALAEIDSAADTPGCVEAVGRLQWATLKEAGYEPVLDRDVRTGAALTGLETVGFDTRLGGVTGDPGRAGKDAEEVWRVRSDTVRAVGWLARSSESNSGDIPPSPAAIFRAARLLGAWIGVVLGEPPAAQVAFFEWFTRAR